MTLPHITICDCVSERTGKPHVTIPRLQYEALMAAAEAIPLAHEFIGSLPAAAPPGHLMAQRVFRKVDDALAALRAAGIEIEG